MMADNALTTQPTAFEQELASYEPQFAAALPGHIPPERFRRTVITALNQNPDLMKADRRSLFTACVRAAQDGLFPDGREAALVVFNTKNRRTGEWGKGVQYMPMIAGILKRMRNSGEVAAISAYVVFANDKFDYDLGDDPHITHKPALGERGAAIGVYAIAKLTNGETLREVMSVAEVDKVRSVGRSKNDGPWVGWWEEMSRKTVLRRLAKRLPGSSDIDELLQREEAQYSGNGHDPAAALPARPTRAMYREPPIVTEVDEEPEDELGADEPPHDEKTGEIRITPLDVFAATARAALGTVGAAVAVRSPDPSPLVTFVLPPRDAETGEISDEPTPYGLEPLLAAGDAVCERGTEALKVWWTGLSSGQRGTLGAHGRSSGSHMEGWKVRAAAADERGWPAPEPEDDEHTDDQTSAETPEQPQAGAGLSREPALAGAEPSAPRVAPVPSGPPRSAADFMRSLWNSLNAQRSPEDMSAWEKREDLMLAMLNEDDLTLAKTAIAAAWRRVKTP